MLDFIFQNYTTDRQFGEEFFKKILKKAVEMLNLKEKNISISLNLAGEAKIKELNKKYRNKNKATDVLSFPLRLAPLTQGKPGAKGKSSKVVEGQLLDLGDVFICLSIAKKEAKRENVNIEKKLAHLTVHGFLHLTGYDHECSEKNAEKMLKLEERILSKLD